MILVDTTVWIDFFKGRNKSYVDALHSLLEQREDLCLCGVILTEILQGIKNEKEYRITETLLSNLIYLPMKKETFILAANIFRVLRSKGITVRKSIDCMISAVAIENNIFLLHNDEDFDLIAKYSELKLFKA